MTKDCARDPMEGVDVETWLSAAGHGQICSFTSPYPRDIRHHISITHNKGYPLDFYVYGRIASGFSNVAYTSTPVTDKWNKAVSQVQNTGQADHVVQVSPLSLPARIQAYLVEYDSPWSGRTALILNKLRELSVDVK